MARTTVGSLPAQVDLLVYQGDDLLLSVTVDNPGEIPADLTGYTARAQIRPSAPSAVVLAEFTTAIAANVISLTLTAEVTSTLTRNAAWDLQITSPGGVVTTLAYGVVKVTKEVTR